MVILTDIIEKVKDVLSENAIGRKVFDKDVATALNIPQATFATMKKRNSRAKLNIRQKNISYEIPEKSALNQRTKAVLHVIYLIFNEGYCASSGEDHVRKELTDEAIYLARKLVELCPSSESLGLLALLLLQASRIEARVTNTRDLISLEDQDRTLWNKSFIDEGVELIRASVMTGRLGTYTLQAAIASVHALSESIDEAISTVACLFICDIFCYFPHFFVVTIF